MNNLMIALFTVSIFLCSPLWGVVEVKVSNETTPVKTLDDSADDPAIWYNEHNPERSLIIGTNKQLGLIVYNLDGLEISSYDDLPFNNVDLIEHFKYRGKEIPLIVASTKIPASVSLFTLDQARGELIPLAIELPTHPSTYGLCLYQNPKDQSTFIIVTGKDGRVEQWRVEEKNNQLAITLARQFSFKTQTEGCVADPENQTLFFAEENYGIWKVDARAEYQGWPELVYSIFDNEFLVPDLEGIDIYFKEKGKGQIVISVQGKDEFAVLDRMAPHRYQGSFRLIGHQSVDGVSGSDGLSISSKNFGHQYPQGLLVVQDDINHNEKGEEVPQNFKLVKWHEISNNFHPPL